MSDPFAYLNTVLDGRYRVEQELGEGAMGVVYQARQANPSRVVALKVIRPGAVTEKLLHRFVRESEVLGRLQHPGIARIYEAGTADGGRLPYFAMERVSGRPLLAHANETELDTAARLELVARIADAVHHAHQRGVIHRDLKPGNILIDEEGQPKVLDFGIARVTDADVQATMGTEVGQLIGTLAYMSPEQVDADPLDLDTRSDVYALGVILFELIAGRRPYSLGSHFAATLRTITEEEPPPLGTLDKAWSGDVEAIVSKSLEKDRDDRYQSAAELAADLRRHLSNEPVEARPLTTLYQLKKFAARHRTLVRGAAATTVALLGGLAATSYFMVQAQAQRDRAEREAAKAETINEFMEETLLAPDPMSGLGRDVTVAEALARAAARVDSTLGGEPESAATARAAIGWAYLRLGRYEEAEPLLLAALREREALLAGDDSDVAESIFQWASLLGATGRYDEAEPLHRTALAVRRDHPGEESAVVESLTALGILLSEVGRLDAAETSLREALSIADQLDPDSRDVAALYNHIGVALWNKGELEEIEPLWQGALALRRQALGNEHPEVAESLNNLAVLYDNTDRPEAAESLYREALDVQRKLLGPQHEEVTAIMTNLAILLDNAGAWAEAEELYRDVLRIDRDRLGAEHLYVGYDLSSLGAFLCNTERAAEGTQAIWESLTVHEANLEDGHWRIGNVRQWLGFCLTRLGQFDEAETQLRDGMIILSDALGADHFRVDAAREKLIDLLEAAGRPDDAMAERELLRRN